MQNDLKYTVRSREVVDLYSAIRSSRLTLSPYFQRNLVWRESHKRDFIDTILKGYPFPQIFLARGPINLNTLEASQAVVDGQQRLNAIKDFIEEKLDINGKTFKQLSDEVRESFLKYEVAVIDFDLNADDPKLKEVFHRLNRTYYSLSAIERLASEFSASEFMLVARVLCGEIQSDLSSETDDIDVDGDDGDENPFSRDPGIDSNTWTWLLAHANGPFSSILQKKPIFTKFEFDRKIPLMFTLNLMCTFLSGYYQRNDKVRKYLDDKSQSFPERDEVVSVINKSAAIVDSLNIGDNSIWWNKANFFTLITEISKSGEDLDDISVISGRLAEFSNDIPENYALAAREAVSRKAQRETRAKYLRPLLTK